MISNEWMKKVLDIESELKSVKMDCGAGKMFADNPIYSSDMFRKIEEKIDNISEMLKDSIEMKLKADKQFVEDIQRHMF